MLKHNYSKLLIIAITLFPTFSFAQENINEELFEINEEISEETDNYELLLDLRENPIDINKASPEQLMIIPMLQPSTALNICNYRDRIGGYSSLDEVKKIFKIDNEIFRILKQFVVIDRIIKERKLDFEIRSRIINPLEKSKGYTEGKYFDSKLKQYNRMIINYGEKLSGGILFEKDSGEKKFNDHQSFFLELKNILNLKKVIFGNYQMEFGEGLLFWNPYGFRKGSDGIYPIKKRGRGIIGYKSTFENGGLNGISVNGEVKFLNYYLFYSNRNIDANENVSGNITSLFDSGLHRTELELSKVEILNENLYGARFEFKLKNNGWIGITHYQSSYNKEFIPDDRDIYRFNGSDNNLFSLDFKYYFKQANFFGEFAKSKSGGIGSIVGTIFSFDNTMLGISFRSYDKDFYSFYGRGFSERSSENRNERGIYIGLNHKITSRLKLYSYFDQFRFPWRTYYIPFPSSGYDEMVRLTYNKSPKTKFEVKVRNNKEDTNIKVLDEKGNEMSKIGNYRRTSLRFQIDKILNNKFKLRWRTEGILESETSVEKIFKYDNSDKGILNYLDFEISSLKYISLNFRYTYFTSKKSKIPFYQFDRDLPGILKISRLQGIGNEFYLLIRCKIGSNIDLALKYSLVNYPKAIDIGSGYDEIKGNNKRFLGCQLRILN